MLVTLSPSINNTHALRPLPRPLDQELAFLHGPPGLLLSSMSRCFIDDVVRGERIVHVERIPHNPEIAQDEPRAGKNRVYEGVQD